MHSVGDVIALIIFIPLVVVWICAMFSDYASDKGWFKG
jgi:hypothetical protein